MPIELLQIQNYFKFVTGRDKMKSSLKKQKSCPHISKSVEKKKGCLMYILRKQYLEEIRKYYDSNLIKVLTGIRRVGKSVLLEQIREELKRDRNLDEEHIICINFEDITFSSIENAYQLNDYISNSLSLKSLSIITSAMGECHKDWIIF